MANNQDSELTPQQISAKRAERERRRYKLIGHGTHCPSRYPGLLHRIHRTVYRGSHFAYPAIESRGRGIGFLADG